MKKLVQAVLLLFAIAGSTLSQHADHKAPSSEKPIRLLDPTGFVHLKVSTDNPDAQKYFDQGLTLQYAYNGWDALRSFKRAAELDPSMAMAWWAIADTAFVQFSGQPDYTKLIKESRDALTKALGLKATPRERAIIEVLAKRFSDAEEPDAEALRAEYRSALKKLHETYPDDPDIATWYALSLGYDWSKEGKPIGDTAITITVLENGLKKTPDHLGLNHQYIHASEASQQPERAMRSADYLRALKLKEPELGHLVHMPAHIYIRMGDFQKAAESNNETAVNVNSNVTEEFKDAHFSHVFQFLRLSYYMQGNYAKLHANAIAISDFAYPNPNAEQLKSRGVDLNSMVRFRRWKDILDYRIPVETAVSHYTRGHALAATGKVADAEESYAKYLGACKCSPASPIAEGASRFDANTKRVSVVNAGKLAARIAEAKRDNSSALDYLQRAVTIEDEISYSEPPMAIEPARVNLGGLLLRMNRFTEAEAVFRKDLQYHRGNGRSLFGLMKALEGQKKRSEAKSVQKQFEAAWRYADTTLSIQDL